MKRWSRWGSKIGSGVLEKALGDDDDEGVSSLGTSRCRRKSWLIPRQWRKPLRLTIRCACTWKGSVRSTCSALREEIARRTDAEGNEAIGASAMGGCDPPEEGAGLDKDIKAER